MPLQTWIHHWEEGAGARVIKAITAILAFVAVAALYDLLNYESFASEEAMETAQVARNVAQGRGYTTDSIRPLALYLLQAAAPPGQSSKVLAQRVPDLTTPPAYPLLLAGLMKMFPFQFTAYQLWSYPPERWISILNQALFFAAVCLLFFLGRQLFSPRVAWLAAILFAGTRLFWKFSVSGLSTLWVIVILLALVSCLVSIERRSRATAENFPNGLSVLLALAAGLLLGLGGLSRYAFAWMIVPAVLFVGLSVTRGRWTLCLTLAAAFLLVMAPWVVRNAQLSGHGFGTADFAVVQGTDPFPGDTIERSTDPRGRMERVAPRDIMNKLLGNAREMCANVVPKLGGNWISAFFFAGFFIPFRNPGLTRLRWFLVGSLVLFFVVEALGRTAVTHTVPEINSENLLVILSPLVFLFGAAFFDTLIDQLNLPPLEGRSVFVAGFACVLCAPLFFGLAQGRTAALDSPYSPRHIQQASHWMQTNELLMSDIPGGVAWYGQRSCVWLPLDDDRQFFRLNALKPVRGLFLTQPTMDQSYLSQMLSPQSWGQFALQCSEHGEVPVGFPLRKSPAGLLPEQIFLSDKVRWQTPPNKGR